MATIRLSNKDCGGYFREKNSHTEEGRKREQRYDHDGKWSNCFRAMTLGLLLTAATALVSFKGDPGLRPGAKMIWPVAALFTASAAALGLYYRKQALHLDEEFCRAYPGTEPLYPQTVKRLQMTTPFSAMPQGLEPA